MDILPPHGDERRRFETGGAASRSVRAVEMRVSRNLCSLAVRTVFPSCGVVGVKINRQTGVCPLCAEHYHLEQERAFNEVLERERAAAEDSAELEVVRRERDKMRQRNSRLCRKYGLKGKRRWQLARVIARVINFAQMACGAICAESLMHLIPNELKLGIEIRRVVVCQARTIFDEVKLLSAFLTGFEKDTGLLCFHCPAGAIEAEFPVEVVEAKAGIFVDELVIGFDSIKASSASIALWHLRCPPFLSKPLKK